MRPSPGRRGPALGSAAFLPTLLHLRIAGGGQLFRLCAPAQERAAQQGNAPPENRHRACKAKKRAYLFKPAVRPFAICFDRRCFMRRDVSVFQGSAHPGAGLSALYGQQYLPTAHSSKTSLRALCAGPCGMRKFLIRFPAPALPPGCGPGRGAPGWRGPRRHSPPPGY